MWTCTDDDFHFDERVVDLSLPQLAFLSGAIHYCFKKNTGGRIKSAVLGSLIADPHRSGIDTVTLAENLVTAGLLVKAEHGYALSRYTLDNLVQLDPPEVVEARRAKQRQKMRDWRRNQVTNQVTNRVRDEARNHVRDAAQTRPDQTSTDQDVQSPTETALDPSGPSVSSKPSKPKKPKPQQAELVEASTAQSEADPKPEKKLTDAQRLWNVYREAFFVDCGSYPTAQRHYFVQLDALLRQHTLAVLVERLKVYFTSPAWIGKSGARDFGRFLKYIDSWALPEAETAEESVERMFVKGPQRMAQIANGRANPLLNGTNAP